MANRAGRGCFGGWGADDVAGRHRFRRHLLELRAWPTKPHPAHLVASSFASAVAPCKRPTACSIPLTATSPRLPHRIPRLRQGSSPDDPSFPRTSALAFRQSTLSLLAMSVSSGPTGEILRDLPSAYIPHPATGLLHLPRFIAKIRRHLRGELPASYQRNFCRGFDGFLCLHLGIEPEAVIEAVRSAGDDDHALDQALLALFPADLRVAEWNRSLVQKGMSDMGREALQQAKERMGAGHRHDLLSFADMIDFDEGRIA